MENDNKFLDFNKTKKSKTTPKNKNEQTKYKSYWIYYLYNTNYYYSINRLLLILITSYFKIQLQELFWGEKKTLRDAIVGLFCV